MVRKTLERGTPGKITHVLVVVDRHGKEHDLEYNYEGVLQRLIRIRHQNIVRVIAYDLIGDKLLIYSPYYHGGTLQKTLLAPDFLTRRSLAHIVVGGWQGLMYIHKSMRVLHNDINAANIFLHQETSSSSVIGLVGDVDGALPIVPKQANEYVCHDAVQYLRTRCHGSPFRNHYDTGRDLAAMLMVTVSGILRWGHGDGDKQFDWKTHCVSKLGRQQDVRVWGYHLPTPHRNRGVYNTYTESTRDHAPTDLLRTEPVLHPIAKLDNKNSWPPYYQVVDSAVHWLGSLL